MPEHRSPPTRRGVLHSLAAASSVGLAGCGSHCDPGPGYQTLAVDAADGPRAAGDGWRLDVTVEHETYRARGPLEAARLVAFDADEERLGRWDLAPFSEAAGYDRSTEAACLEPMTTYAKQTTLRTVREPKYVNPYVPASECPGIDLTTRPLIVGEDRSPRFRCTQRFPFELFDTATAPAHDNADWPTVWYDAARTAHNPDGAGPESEPSVAWTVPVGRDSTVPVVDYGAVYLMADGHYSGDGFSRFTRGTLVAFDVETGDLAWSVENGGSKQGMAVSDWTLFAAAAELVAYEATTGRRSWSVDPDARFASGPAVKGGTVAAVDSDGVARGFATESGKQQWASEVGTPVGPPLFGIEGGVLAADGDSLYVDVEGAVRALDLDTGEIRWDRSLESTAGLPQVGPDTLYAVVADTVVALATDDGAERWRRSMTRVPPAVGVGPDSVYVAGSDGVSALAAADGTERWTTDLEEVDEIRGLVNGRLYVTGDSGLHVFDAATGDRLEWLLDDVEFQFPVVADGRIVDLSDDGALRTFAGE